MRAFSVIAVLLAVGLRFATAQGGYNYDRPEGGRPTGGAQGGFPSSATTPSYVAPGFGSNQGGAPGYNYQPQADTDFPTAAAPTGGVAGYPTGPQGGRPQAGGFTPATGGSSAPYPSAGQPTGPYPAQGQAQGAPAVGRPGVIQGAGPQGFGVPSATGFGGPQAGSGIGVSAIGAGPQGGSPLGQGGIAGQQQDENQEGDYSAIPGEPEIDYPIFSEIPETSFDCAQQEFPGYYADVEARCQVFHVCAFNNTRKYDFLCPNGTIFSQEFLVCVWWNQFDCNSAPGLFANNANLYETPQSNQQGQGGAVAGQGQGGIASDFPSASGPSAGGAATGPYPSAGRPSAPGSSFGGANQGIPSTAYGPPPQQQGAGGYQPSAPSAPAGNYPSGPSQQGGGYPSTQGPYPSGPSVPSSGYQPQAYPSQADTPYPPSSPAGGAQGTTPPRDYLPPTRRG